jgi:hypothetical protein
MDISSKRSGTAPAVIWMIMALAGFSLLAVVSRELTVQMGTLDIFVIGSRGCTGDTAARNSGD